MFKCKKNCKLKKLLCKYFFLVIRKNFLYKKLRWIVSVNIGKIRLEDRKERLISAGGKPNAGANLEDYTIIGHKLHDCLEGDRLLSDMYLPETEEKRKGDMRQDKCSRIRDEYLYIAIFFSTI